MKGKPKRNPESPLISAFKAQMALISAGWAFENRALQLKGSKACYRPGILRRARECHARARGLSKVINVLAGLATFKDKEHIRTIAKECRKMARRIRNA